MKERKCDNCIFDGKRLMGLPGWDKECKLFTRRNPEEKCGAYIEAPEENCARREWSAGGVVAPAVAEHDQYVG